MRAEQRNNLIETSTKNLQEDYENQIQLQAQCSNQLQNELENLKCQSADLSQRGNAMNCEFMDDKANFG